MEQAGVNERRGLRAANRKADGGSRIDDWCKELTIIVSNCRLQLFQKGPNQLTTKCCLLFFLVNKKIRNQIKQDDANATRRCDAGGVFLLLLTSDSSRSRLLASSSSIFKEWLHLSLSCSLYDPIFFTSSFGLPLVGVKCGVLHLRRPHRSCVIIFFSYLSVGSGGWRISRGKRIWWRSTMLFFFSFASSLIFLDRKNVMPVIKESKSHTLTHENRLDGD